MTPLQHPDTDGMTGVLSWLLSSSAGVVVNVQYLDWSDLCLHKLASELTPGIKKVAVLFFFFLGSLDHFPALSVRFVKRMELKLGCHLWVCWVCTVKKELSSKELLLVKIFNSKSLNLTREVLRRKKAVLFHSFAVYEKGLAGYFLSERRKSWPLLLLLQYKNIHLIPMASCYTRSWKRKNYWILKK